MEWKIVDNNTPRSSDGAPNPGKAGTYRVVIGGDSETCDGHVIYDYPDYESWATWFPAEEDEYEDFDGGYKGHWYCQYDEEGEWIIAYYGPIEIPAFPGKKILVKDAESDKIKDSLESMYGYY